MCRHIAYTGPPTTLSQVLLDPDWSLRRQSYEPRHQTFGRVNADGFGVGFYTDVRPEPAVYRTVKPIWADQSFASLAGVISSGCFVASVRSATPPNPVEESGCQPFVAGRWSFAHNGSLNGYPVPTRAQLLDQVTAKRAAAIVGASDSEVVFAMIMDCIDTGAEPADALRKTMSAVRAVTPARLNLVLTDGQTVYATESGDTLYVLRTSESTTIASEPYNDSPEWDKVPAGRVVSASNGNCEINEL